MLSSKQSISREQYREGPETRDVVERRFEKATQASVDIARVILKDIDGQAPASNAAAMERLGERDVLSNSTADSMARAASFRNVLAHEYGDVLDHDVVYEALQDLSRYRDFLYEVRGYLDEVGAL